MGCVYRLKESKFWWIKYIGLDRKPHYESSKSTRKGDAIALVKLREGDLAHGIPVTAKIGRLTFDEAAQDLVTEYETNGRKSLTVLQRRITKHLTPFCGGRRMSTLSTTDVRAYVKLRQSQPIIIRKAHREKLADGTWREVPAKTKVVSNAEINRELATLKRIFNLAIEAGRLTHAPHIPMLQERNVRTGFFEREQYLSVLKHLPAAIQPVITFAYITGWRIDSEVLPLEWRQVDFEAGEVRLDKHTTKNDDGRVFPMTRDLRALLESQRAASPRQAIVPSVFHRDGDPIKRFNKAWKTACKAAGCPGRIPHDFRRTAVRNLVRAGIPERVAMQMTGHKTRSVFERYNIVSEGDLTEAARRLDATSSATLGISRGQ